MKLTQVCLLFIAVVTLLCGKVYAIYSGYIFVPAITVCGFGIIIPVVYMVAGKNLFYSRRQILYVKNEAFRECSNGQVQ